MLELDRSKLPPETKTLDAVEDRVARDVTLASLNVQTALKTIGVTGSLRSSARDAYDLAKARYETGIASIVELSQAEVSKTDAEIQNVNATYEFRIQLAILSFQTGTLLNPPHHENN